MFLSADRENTGEVRRLDGAEREFLHALCLDYYPVLRRYAWNLGFRGEAVEDWLQETFLIAIRRIDVLRNSDNPGPYLTQILRNVIGHQLRSMKYAAQIAEKLRETESAEPEGYRDDPDPEILYRGLVSDGELRLLIRFYLEGRSQKELARELGIDVGACNMRLQRAKAHLKAAMERDGLR